MLRPIVKKTATESARDVVMHHAPFAIILSMSVALHVIIVAFGTHHLSFDEAYYWHWSKQLDWCYFSKGPGIALLIAATTAVLGDTEIGIRAGAIVCSALMLVILYSLTLSLFRCRRTACWATALASCAPLYFGLGILTTIDSPLVLWWAAAVIATWHAGQREAGIFPWIAVGLAVAVGAQFKFTALLFPMAIITWLWIDPTRRVHLRRPGIYLAGTVMLSALVPILIWNVQHDWITLFHTMNKATTNNTKALVTAKYLLPSLGTQLALVSPIIGIAMLVALYCLVRDSFKPTTNAPNTMNASPARFLLAMSLPIALFYSVIGLHRMVEGNWLSVLYVPLFPAAAYYWLRPFSRVQRVSLHFAVATSILVIAPILANDLLYEWRLPERLKSWGVPFDPRWDVTNRLHGWRELGPKLAEEARLLTQKTGKPTIFYTDHYSRAALIGFYAKVPNDVFVLKGPTIENQFDVWGVLGRVPSSGVNAIWVHDAQHYPHLPTLLFESEEDNDERISVYRGQTPVRTFLVRRAFGFRGMHAWK